MIKPGVSRVNNGNWAAKMTRLSAVLKSKEDDAHSDGRLLEGVDEDEDIVSQTLSRAYNHKETVAHLPDWPGASVPATATDCLL